MERATIDGRIAAPATPQPLILVDDHRDMREALAMVLRSKGYRAVTAIDGSEALDMVTREPPDLILLDYAMPGLDGAGFCRAYRQRGGEASIVLMTAGLLVTLADAALIDGLGWAGAHHRVDGLGHVPTYAARCWPVSVERAATRSAGVPSKTIRPPSWPAPGPRSMIQSAWAITA